MSERNCSIACNHSEWCPDYQRALAAEKERDAALMAVHALKLRLAQFIGLPNAIAEARRVLGERGPIENMTPKGDRTPEGSP